MELIHLFIFTKICETLNENKKKFCEMTCDLHVKSHILRCYYNSICLNVYAGLTYLLQRINERIHHDSQIQMKHWGEISPRISKFVKYHTIQSLIFRLKCKNLKMLRNFDLVEHIRFCNVLPIELLFITIQKLYHETKFWITNHFRRRHPFEFHSYVKNLSTKSYCHISTDIQDWNKKIPLERNVKYS